MGVRKATGKGQTQSEEPWARLEQQWGVASCRHCGAILVLGEGMDGPRWHAAAASLCPSCQALPSPRPRAERVRVGVAGVVVRPQDRLTEERLSDAA
jgi:hypothetical protein